MFLSADFGVFATSLHCVGFVLDSLSVHLGSGFSQSSDVSGLITIHKQCDSYHNHSCHNSFDTCQLMFRQ